ncbi:MAG TPA: universal stress protein, partial [Burkholderiales bacterium]|nr:universal stress protein [Burkholderiales bacterium]
MRAPWYATNDRCALDTGQSRPRRWHIIGASHDYAGACMKILVAVDGSKTSLEAVNWLVAHAN